MGQAFTPLKGSLGYALSILTVFKEHEKPIHIYHGSVNIVEKPVFGEWNIRDWHHQKQLEEWPCSGMG